MLHMQNIGKLYQTEMVQTQALREFNLTVEEGEFIAVTGPSGSGKTTFLNIAGLLEPYSSGQYTLDGIDIGKLNDNQRSDLRNQKIGFIFQGFNLIPDLDLFENIEVPLRYRGIKAKERKKRVEQCLEQVGLAGRARHLPQQLSGGQQQRVAIARALAGEPRFLLADEPTGNLDSLMARQVMTLLEELNQSGTTIVMVTHDQELARRTPRNIQIVDGQVADFTLYQGGHVAREAINKTVGA
ncbi:ABC transporter ATP-binding protein [Pseudoalteromonas luteoviolacea]|uniref:Phosphonate ABC transporter ATP-binding protein n=1 Tax=Pseudoalteromonas luteoviolacea H33 TaxID=1365251 RepID=A0A161Y0N8_9GAMM|nr:ABC transporter ATP-binding protein [Pseudoalteromonas luteoviolacea]KZN49312.1 phosphonate ABC transporter ATP-binding protein [Pseudoalteromonas luteoviolacea H33]KZN74885.1 phosphonate ABC transporter ATP-binding protein [Pseudoalteromonas luteoviolacea H33-S]MBQ4878333.1 ABC transporter ATP-binding protein [Pseudoalteromonas luteoviolacea]MBQ4907488.1 ABC transporter ATP-binding protein [Pseudoalteromonas luteoviolacea]